MFSPNVNAGISTRNPRRRQRTGSDDSTSQRHRPKRLRRSGISAETFKPPSSKQVNGYIQHVDNPPLVNGHVHDPKFQRDASVDTASLAIRNRAPKKVEREKRGNKTDGSIELTKNDNYMVTQLPTTPERLQNNQKAERWQGEIAAHVGYAVAMNHSQATVWRYIQGVSPNESSQPFTIKLQHSASDVRGPIPFGLVVPTAAEPAFLVVTATSGHITYWESLSSAASIDPSRQKQQGTQGAVSGMMSGEIITRVTEAEPHGFLLTFNTGRVAHMTVSDPQGKPLIKVQFLRSSAAYAGGLFGSLKNVFSSSGWRRDVAAVKAGSSWQRGQRYAVVATTRGVFQVWDLNWNGSHSLVYEIDAKEDLVKALADGGDIPQGKDDPSFQVLDFAFLPGGSTGKELVKSIEKGDCKLLVLTVMSDVNFSRYALVGLNLAGGSFAVDVVHPISCFTSSIPAESNFRPQILVPEPAQTAYIVFETSVVLVSLVSVEDSPSSQLQMEAHTLPKPFQDTIDFRRNKSYRVVGCAAEPLERGQAYSSCVLMVFGFGIVRIAALPMKEGQSVRDRATITARTKIEQAVFYGSLQQDLLDFSGRPEIKFTKEEVEKAALEVSDSIMNSSSAYISAILPSMDQQLQRRSIALADLMKHLNKHHEPLDRVTRWKLLWNAEKMAAAGAAWRCYNTAIATKRDQDKNLITELVDMLHENYKSETKPECYETDAVRHWFINDIGGLQYIIPWAQHACEQLFKESVEDGVEHDEFTKARLLSEANDLQLSALETAFRFREVNAALYGLSNEAMPNGVLLAGYEDFEDVIWTSSVQIVPTVKKLVDLSREMAIVQAGNEDESMSKLVEKLEADNPRLVDICCRTYIEKFRWMKSQADEQLRADGRALQLEHFRVRTPLFTKLADLGLAQEGIVLADRYCDMDALVELIDLGMEEEQQRLDQPGTPESDREQAFQTIRHLQAQIKSYFAKFGARWANAYFAKHISDGKTMELFRDAFNYKHHLTTFLRHPTYAKLGWINEVHSEHNYAAAADSLRVAQKKDSSLWGKKIELSMSKLATLAAQSKGQVKDDSAEDAIQKIHRSTAILTMQEKLYDYIRPILKGAIDVTAEIDLALEQCCRRYVKGKPTLRGTLAGNIKMLICREALDAEDLIDTLTLIDEDGLYPDEEGFADNRFLYALKIVKLSSFETGERARKNLHEMIIWRRCMIQDDWEAINRTELKDDTQVEVETGATALFKTLREGYRTDFFTTSALIPPPSVLGAGITLSSLRASTRYTEMADDKLDRLRKDLESEDVLLETYIEKGRLEMWWKGVVEAAQRSARDEKDQAGEERRRRRSLETGFWKGLETKDKEEQPVEFDGQGDVVMGD